MNVTLNIAARKETPTGGRERDQLRRLPTLSKLLHLWHLLSLDAPTVAAVWTYFIAAALGVRIPCFAPFAMFLTVWIVYVGDRLLDARQLSFQSFSVKRLEERHHFHHSHRRAFLVGVAGAALPLAVLLLRIPTKAVHLYLLLGGLLLGYFVIIHAVDKAASVPKELIVGLIFAAAVFIPTVAPRPELGPALVPSALLVATLCSLNCFFIYSWEHELREASLQESTHAITRVALRYLNQITIFVIVGGAVLPLLDRQTPWMISLACSLSAMLLLQVHRSRRVFSPTTLRATTFDLVLLVPILLLPFLSHV
jgi:small-conductance mechanosensitive channel